MSTRCEREKRAAGEQSPALPHSRRPDLADEVAIVACARRSLLLGVHRHRLRREDLEDCYSQASLELIAHAKKGGTFADRLHIANAIELRFLSRVRDRHRATGGRSPMQSVLEQAMPLADEGGEDGAIEVIDLRASVETVVLARDDLRALGRATRELTLDQRRLLASQLADETCERCCARWDWSREKYRKIAQRARARLRREIESNEMCPLAGTRSEQASGPTNGHHLTRS